MMATGLGGPEREWEEHAMCSQTDPEAFFPEKGGSARDAKFLCAQCTVAAECLDYAIANEERFGVWGGMGERERRKLRRQLAIHSTPPAVSA